MHPAESSNATFFMVADHSLDRSWTGTAAQVAFVSGSSSTSSSEPEVRAVYATPRRASRPRARR